jgi:HD-GYP domain-containing protein (c-di-GMP phosphodiesterase class II)
MARLRLKSGDVSIGKPLPFALMDSGGRTLLSIGYVIPNDSQLERLIERGVFFDAFDDEVGAHQLVEHVSVYRLVIAVAEEYQTLLAVPPDITILPRLEAVAGEISKLCALDADAALAFILLHKDARYSIRHAFAAAILTEVLMRELKQSADDVRRAVMGALAMNLCMLELQDDLYRQEVALTLEQKQSIVLHPQRASRLLAECGCTDAALLGIVEDHHETINGAGYARRKKAPDLPLAAQVVSLADRYCAVVSERAYRAATPPNIAARELLSRQAATIDTLLSAHFIKVIGIYPPGAVVTLANGETAVVVRRTLHPVQPVVRSLRSRSGVRYPEPPKRLTSKESFSITDTASPDHLKGVDLASLWPPVEESADGEG